MQTVLGGGAGMIFSSGILEEHNRELISETLIGSSKIQYFVHFFPHDHVL